MTAVPMGGVSWTAAVTQARVRLDATERVVASAQLEASLADDDAQSVHAELDRHRRSTTVKEFSLKLARCRVLPMRAPLVNWKTPCSIGRLWTYRLGRRSPSGCTQGTRECQENRGP